MAETLLVMEGLTEFRRAIAKADAQAGDDMKSVLLDVAKPMAAHATSLALQGIPVTYPMKEHGSGGGVGHAWALNRIGLTRAGLYIVPNQRGRQSRRNQRLRRPKFGQLLLERAYDPTAAAFEGRVEAAAEHALDRIVHTIEHA